eukprot:2125415-Pyramimonas_sp.AAC.1
MTARYRWVFDAEFAPVRLGTGHVGLRPHRCSELLRLSQDGLNHDGYGKWQVTNTIRHSICIL